MAHTYHIIKSVVRDRRFAWLKKMPSTVKKIWELTEGVSMGNNFPPSAEFPIDPKWGDLLTDLVPNVFNVLIVSKKMRNILEDENVYDIEYLPMIILDKKGRTKSQEHYVANIIGSIDCLDSGKSIYNTDPLEEGQIIDIERIDIFQEKVPVDKKLFRLAQRRHLFIIRDDLLKNLLNHDIIGLETYDMGTKLYIP